MDTKRANCGERHIDASKVKSPQWRAAMDRVANWNVMTLAGGTLPQGTSWCGARDMAGNVWEWCLDVYNPGAYKVRAKRNRTDPWQRGEGARVVRGGSWYLPLKSLKSTNRYKLPPMGGDDRSGIRSRARDVGFRCVRPAK